MPTLQRLRKHLGPLWFNSACLFIVARFGDLVTLVTSAYLVPLLLSTSDLGAIAPLQRIMQLLLIPTVTFSMGPIKFLNKYKENGEEEKSNTLVHLIVRLGMINSILIATAIFLLQDFLVNRLHISRLEIFPMLAMATIAWGWTSLIDQSNRGLKNNKTIISSRMIGPLLRLLFILLLLKPFQLSGFLSASAFSYASLAIITGYPLWVFIKNTDKKIIPRSELKEIILFCLPVALWMLMRVLQTTVEPFVIRHRLPLADSAGYYLIQTIGALPMLIAPSIFVFLFPALSERYEKKLSTFKIHTQALGLVGILSIVATLALYLRGEWLLQQTVAWQPYVAYSKYLWLGACVSGLTALLTAHMLHQNACRDFRYLRYFIPITLGELGLIYSIWALKHLHALPLAIQQTIQNLLSNPLLFLLGAMVIARLLCLPFMLIEYLQHYRQSKQAKVTSLQTTT